MKRKRALYASLLVGVLAVSGCGYNTIQTLDERVNKAQGDIQVALQRRADLIPNLVATVKGFAAQEERVLVSVTEARAKVGSIQLTPEVLNDPEAFAKFQAAQGELTAALKSLIAVSESYPDLKSNANFRDLQVQLEGTENRITVARNRYIEAVKVYNTTVRSFPTNLTAGMFDFDVKPNFSVENEAAIAAPPSVNFDNTTPAQQAQPVEAAPAAPAGN